MSETTTKKKKYASNFQTACCDTQRGASHFLLDEGCVRALWMPMSLSCFCFLVFFSHSSASANLIYNHEHQMNVYDRTWPGWWDLSWFIVSLLIVRGQASRGQWSLSVYVLCSSEPPQTVSKLFSFFFKWQLKRNIFSWRKVGLTFFLKCKLTHTMFSRDKNNRLCRSGHHFDWKKNKKD